MSYYDTQFCNYAKFPLTHGNYPYGVDLQMRTTEGKTNWLRINPETAKKIEKLICEDKQDG